MQFILEGEIVPKARPRFNGSTVSLPVRYRHWKDAAICSLSMQWHGVIPLESTSVKIVLKGKHHRGSDIDNIAGSVLDALVQAKVLRNDNLAVVKELSIVHLPSDESPVCLIELNPYGS